MEMGVVHQRLPPRVEHRDAADLGAQMFGIGGESPERLGDRPEEEAVDDRLVLGGDLRDRLGQGEDDVEVLALEEVLRAGLDPGRPRKSPSWSSSSRSTRATPSPNRPVLCSATMTLLTEPAGPVERSLHDDNGATQA